MLQSGARVKRDSVILELSDPQLQHDTVDAEYAYKASQADLANLKVERGEMPRLPVAKEAGVGARHVRPKKLNDAHRTPAPIDFVHRYAARP